MQLRVPLWNMMWAGEQPLALKQLQKLGKCYLKICSFLFALHQQLLDILDGCLCQSFGLRVVWTAGLVLDAIVCRVSLEAFAEELRAPVRASGLGESRILEPLLVGPGDNEGIEVVVVKWCIHG